MEWEDTVALGCLLRQSESGESIDKTVGGLIRYRD